MNSGDVPMDKMNAQQVSRYLRISLSTVHHLTRTGKLKSVKVGKQWIYSRADIDRYLERGLEYVGNAQVEDRSERRRHSRKKCLIQGHAVVSFPENQTWEGSGNILDFSKGGLLFEIDDPYLSAPSDYESSHVVVKLQIPSLKNVEYGFEGRIAYLKQDHKSRIGIQFMELIPDESEAILASIA